jgi:hypothetical protein
VSLYGRSDVYSVYSSGASHTSAVSARNAWINRAFHRDQPWRCATVGDGR